MRASRVVAAAVAITTPAAALSVGTRFTDRLGATAPIVLAPMGGCAGGTLAAAVTAAGGIGLVGSGGETLDFLREEWAIALAHPQVERSRLGFGLNVGQLEEYSEGTLQSILRELQPAHVYLSFGDIAPHAATVLDHGAALYSNAGSCEAALAHARAGASCVVMQGSDAGGGQRARRRADIPMDSQPEGSSGSSGSPSSCTRTTHALRHTTGRAQSCSVLHVVDSMWCALV